MTPGRIGHAVRIGLVLGGLFGVGTVLRGEILEEVVAKVNNSIITRSQFQDRLSGYRQQLSAHYTGDELDAKLAALQDSLLHDMVIETLLVQRADVLLDMEKVRKNLLEDFKKQQKISSDQELDRLLKEQKMSRRDLLDTLVRMSIPQEVINYEVRRKISVSDKDIQAYYDAHHQEFVKPERVLFREVVILFEDATREEARARAEAVKRQLDAGTDFAKVVAEESQAASKDRGGLSGPFTRGELRPEIEKAVFVLSPGQVAGPIESARAFHFFRLETHEPEQITPLADAREGIIEKIRDGKFKEKLDEYLKKLWADNYIYVFPKYGTSEWKPVGLTEKGLETSP